MKAHFQPRRKRHYYHDKYARNVHNSRQHNERLIISVFENGEAILESESGREVWQLTTDDDGRKGVIVDNKPYRFVSMLQKVRTLPLV